MEEDDFTELYRRFSPAVRRRAFAMLQDAEEAADVTQDAFLAYILGASSLRGEASPFTVLFQMVTYKAVDRLRRIARWSGVFRPLDVSEDEAAAWPGAWAPSHDGGLGRVEAMKDLALLFEDESPQTVTAASLYMVEGLTYKEVGQVLDLSSKTVSRLVNQFAESARKRSARLGSRGMS